MTIDFYMLTGSVPCQSVLMLAKALGIKLNLKETNLKEGETRTPQYLKMNPQHTIPTIDDDGFILWESRSILRYLVEQYGKNDALYPKDPKKRAVINQRLDFDLGTLYTKFINYYSPILYTGAKPNPQHVSAFGEPIEFLEKFLEGQEWVAGKNISIADYAILVSIANMEAVGYDLNKHPNVSRWFTKAKKTVPGYNEIAVTGIAALSKMFEQAQK